MRIHFASATKKRIVCAAFVGKVTCPGARDDRMRKISWALKERPV